MLYKVSFHIKCSLPSLWYYIIAIIPYSKWFNIILYFHIFVSHATAQIAYSWHECSTLEHHNASICIYCSDFQHTYTTRKILLWVSSVMFIFKQWHSFHFYFMPILLSLIMSKLLFVTLDSTFVYYILLKASF